MMIIVLGQIIVKSDALDEARTLCLEHVNRSRAEPGCVSHEVSVDCENPSKFVFVEHWADADALKAHFALKASQKFVDDLRGLVAAKPVMKIYRADEADLSA